MVPPDLRNRVRENICARGSALIPCPAIRVCRSIKKSGLDADVGAIAASFRLPHLDQVWNGSYGARSLRR